MIDMQHLKKYTRETGQIVRYYEVFIPKSGAKPEITFIETPVLLANGNEIVVMGQYNRFQLLQIKKTKYNESSTTLSQCKAYIRQWGPGLRNYDGLMGHLWTYQSEKIVKRRVHTAMRKVIYKEYGAYGVMVDKFEEIVSNS
jgi:hypothetical protein